MDVSPICTWSPTCSSDIITDCPFSRSTLPEAGKQPPPPPDGAAVVVVVVVVVGGGVVVVVVVVVLVVVVVGRHVRWKFV